MESRKQCRRCTLIAMLFICLTGLSMLAGCPNPRYRLLFGEENNRKEEFRLRSEAHKLDLKMTGTGGYIADLEVWLLFDIRKLSASSTLDILYDSVCVLYKGTPMALCERKIMKGEKAGSGRHKFLCCFRCEVDAGSIFINADGQTYDIPIEIALNGALLLDGKPIPVDTIMGQVRHGYLPTGSDQPK